VGVLLANVLRVRPGVTLGVTGFFTELLGVNLGVALRVRLWPGLFTGDGVTVKLLSLLNTEDDGEGFLPET